ncbi:hypothetical protein BT69DRAFT_1349390, partial [Atractiella rhizophila]
MSSQGSILSVHLYPNVIFVHPSPSPTQTPTNDSLVQGVVKLMLSKPRMFKELMVMFEISSTLSFPNKSPSCFVPIIKKELKIDMGKVFEAGDHSSGFSSNLSASQKLHIIANPSPEGEPPNPTSIRMGELLDDLGLFTLAISSPNLTVAGLLHIDFSLHCLLQAFRVDRVECFILQKFELHDLRRRDGKGDRAAVAEVRQSLFIKKRGIEDYAEWVAEAGSEWIFKEWIQLPNDKVLRPSTLEGTDTPIHVSSTIVFQLTYHLCNESGTFGGRALMLSLKQKVDISSCCCLMESLTLPSYHASTSTSSSITTDVWSSSHRSIKCSCGTSIVSLLKSDLNKSFIDSLNSDTAGTKESALRPK